jgi:hypothetical protein
MELTDPSIATVTHKLVTASGLLYIYIFHLEKVTKMIYSETTIKIDKTTLDFPCLKIFFLFDF